MKKLTSPLALFLSLILILSTVAGGIPAVAVTDTAGASLSNPSIDSNGVTTWDCVYFGNYLKAGGDNKEPIKWRVLSMDGSNAFLMSDDVLDEQRYAEIREDGDTSCTWETSALRTWLNQDFYQNAFSQEEQAAILTTNVVNENNADTGTDGGNNTEDKIYVLSVNEVCKAEYGFDTDPDKESRTRLVGEYGEDWWLRTPCEEDRQAIVNWTGSVSRKNEQYVPDNYLIYSVRPVLHLDLDKTSVWTKTDSVKSEETSIPTTRPSTTPTSTPTTKPTSAPTKKPNTTTKPTTTTKPGTSQKPNATSAPKVTPVPRKPAPNTKMKPGEKKAISSFQDLKAMENIPDGNYYLTKDITVPANTQLFWDYPFTGTLDGKGHKIKGFKVQKKFVIGQELKHDAVAGGGHDLIVEEPCAGIFYQASGATFKNLSLTKVNINVQTEDYATVGALVSQATKCTFNNVHVSGKISVKSLRENPLRYTGFDVGGIAGRAEMDRKGKLGSLANCSNSANITVYCKNSGYSDGAQVGGLSGGEFRKMTKCTNSGTISLSGYCGVAADDSMNVAGLVTACAKIKSCTNSGKVTLKVQSAGDKYETPVKLYQYEEADPPEEIQCLGGAFAAGIAKSADNITDSGNTGKIQMGYKLKNIDGVELAGVVNMVNKAKNCYNKGAVSYSGRPMRQDTQSGTGGVFTQFKDIITQCYNKGKVSDRSNKRMATSHQMGGVAAFSGGPFAGVTNCYNAGTISSRKGGRVGGVVGYYDGGWKMKSQKTEPRMKYNYNVGKVKGYKKSYTWGSVVGYCGSLLNMQDKHAVFDNYSTGSYRLYGTGPTSKKLNPLGKKVSRVTKANCPKLSSKYWVYSSKVKRLVLKNNNETKSVKKTKKKSKK